MSDEHRPEEEVEGHIMSGMGPEDAEVTAGKAGDDVEGHIMSGMGPEDAEVTAGKAGDDEAEVEGHVLGLGPNNLTVSETVSEIPSQQ